MPVSDDTPALTSLPSELLALVLRSAAAVFTARPDGKVALPELASLCHAARTSLLTHPELTLRCSGLKRSAHTPNAQHNMAVSWEAQLGAARLPSAPLRPTVLDLRDTDVHAPALCAAFDAAATSGRPIRALALRKCHSVSAAALANVLLHAPRLEVLVCTAHHLSDLTLDALGGLRELRLLCLAECSASADALLACVARLRSLRVLMLGGARLLRPSANGNGDGLLSLNPTLIPPPPSGLDGSRAGAGAAGAEPLCECGPHLALVEHTFLLADDVALLARAAPTADTLDLCAPASTLRSGLERLMGILSGGALRACEGASCVADAALAATLSARCAGFHETALHHAAIEGDAASASLLLAHGANCDVKDAKGNTPLARATFWGHAPVCRLLIAVNADLHRRNHAAESPTYLAALRGHPECLQLLLHADMAVSGGGEAGVGGVCGGCAAREYHDGYTPLHAAVISRSVACMRVLLRAGFNACAQNKYGQSPLHIAASLGGMPDEGLELLLAGGCDPSLRDERKQTAEKVARQRGHHGTAKLLAARLTKHEPSGGAPPTAPPTASIEATTDVNRDGGTAKGGGRGRGRRGRGPRGRGRRGGGEQAQSAAAATHVVGVE